jgi:heme/copper-type cytochrome/quinol oxidase subunit 1
MDILLYIGVALFTVTLIVHRFVHPLPNKLAFGLYVLAAVLIITGMAFGSGVKN